MRDITLDSITQDQFNESSQTLINMIRTRYPQLDLRSGTALRDLLVSPDAIIDAWFDARSAEQRASSSLLTLNERVNAGETIDPDDLNAILSNFNMTSTQGTKARGVVKINVQENREYTVQAGVTFETNTGIVFSVDKETVASETPSTSTEDIVQTQLYKGVSNYYFLVSVTAEENGIDGNIQTGTQLTISSSFLGYMSSYAYYQFSGGSDVEDIDSIISRIPQALSQRGLVTQTAVEGQLRQKYDSTENPIIAVSSCGYGDPAQLRDKHNVLGIGVGGRVDIYVRNFTAMPTKSIVKDFTKTADGYVAEINNEELEAPGLYCVLGVYDAEGGLGSFEFKTDMSADISDTWHDIDISKSYVEAANTIWRQAKVTVVNGDLTDDTVPLQITVALLPEADDIQAHVDSDEIRNLGSDYVVRCPMICNVTITAQVRHPFSLVYPVEKAKADIVNYINTSGFIKRLTSSEIACILQDNGATSVPNTSGGMLYGQLYDGNGKLISFSGDSLDIYRIQNPEALVTEKTCVFVCSPENVHIEVIDN